MPQASAPLFRDPIYDGAADPTVIWNEDERNWWMLYTCRRANVPCQRFAWVHGTDIGIATSNDNGQSWLYRGVLAGLEHEKGRNTFWAPEILRYDGQYHMFVSYVPGVPVDWSGPRYIQHMTSKNLWDWQFESRLTLSSQRVIDACVIQMPDGVWRMWYKDEANGSHTYLAESSDLYDWQARGPAITDCAHEGPNVFAWQGYYWLITDTWKGQAVYRSADAMTWERQADILAESGIRTDDAANGLHADVLVLGKRAYIFYFTHPDRQSPAEPEGTHPLWYKRTSIQVAELEMKDGALVCDRNKPFDFWLDAPAGNQ